MVRLNPQPHTKVSNKKHMVVNTKLSSQIDELRRTQLNSMKVRNKWKTTNITQNYPKSWIYSLVYHLTRKTKMLGVIEKNIWPIFHSIYMVSWLDAFCGLKRKKRKMRACKCLICSVMNEVIFVDPSSHNSIFQQICIKIQDWDIPFLPCFVSY